ncbi:serine/threonine protein kinase [Leptolyngbya cf. ectocarpi LEGE 11479]|uniref:non-specific serine/threonine protein kinase n=1 Tax=Leptolyngbya cf. ectocarpi LEGE 11479 TaxID=1828722 RepID=A0A928ZZL9_LEPEC|nr:serine/threonine-protein kinase [Leptolyngbya ectocarpi]MBE9070429.1 serine/threonine protein kinase [Leptolyngbya cf. ectocarpi LEGE 11479]
MSTPWESGPPLGARYNVLRELGEGGFGRTYLAEDLHRFKERCVLKEFVPQLDDPNLVAKAEELFEREAKVLYQLEHPQIPKFRELMREGGQLFLVQDYVEGTTYRALLQNRQDHAGHFSETEIVQLLYQLLPVLDYIHNLDIIHRDISPENLILRSQDGLPILIDFGSVKQIAATVEQELSASAHKTRIGKVGYVPQEQFQAGSVDATSDLYGLAATLVVLATGKEPQELNDMYENTWNWERFVSFGAPLNQILKKMLAPSPAQRYPSAAAVLQALQGKDAEDNGSNGRLAGNAANVAPMFPEENGGSIAEDVVYPTEAATQVVDSAPETTTMPTSVSPTKQSDNRASLLQAAIGLLALLGISSLILALLVGVGLRPRWPVGGNPDGGSLPTTETPVGPTPDEIARKEELVKRREALGVNEAWLNLWVNQRFYQQYPNLRGRPLTSAPEDAPLRLRWDNLAMDALDILELHLSMPARRGLGAYGADDRESWRQTVNRLNVSSRALEDLTDAKFVSIFPQASRDNLLDQPLGQVWYALARDGVEDLKTNETLERVEFEEGAFRQRLTGQLAAGEGRVFLLNLQAGQNLRINLQVPENSALMSLYVPMPSQEVPFLLSDSSETTWAGTLNQRGYYEIAIASKSANPINYALSVAVDNIITTPPEEEETDPPNEDPDTGEEDSTTDTPSDDSTAPDNGTDTPNNNGENTDPEPENSGDSSAGVEFN